MPPVSLEDLYQVIGLKEVSLLVAAGQNATLTARVAELEAATAKLVADKQAAADAATAAAAQFETDRAAANAKLEADRVAAQHAALVEAAAVPAPAEDPPVEGGGGFDPPLVASEPS